MISCGNKRRWHTHHWSCHCWFLSTLRLGKSEWHSSWRFCLACEGATPLSGGNWTDLKWKPSSLIRHCISCGHSARVGKVTWHWGRLDVLCLGYRAVAGLHMSWLCQLPWSKLYQDESTHWSSWLPQFKPLGEHLWILRPIRNSFGQAPNKFSSKRCSLPMSVKTWIVGKLPQC